MPHEDRREQPASGGWPRRDWLGIVNPFAGGGRSRLAGIVRQLEPVVDRVIKTGEDAGELAAVVRHYRGIVAVGGDGTIFQALQMLDRERQRLAIVPAGRGNSLARDLNLAARVPALDLAAEPERIDLMEVVYQTVDGRKRQCLAASTVALGYPVDVAENANRRFRFLRRHSYATAAAVTLPEPFPAEVLYDNGRSLRASVTGFIVNNTRHIANFIAFPHASCRDGWLDTIELRRGYLGQSLHNLAAMTNWVSYQPSIPVAARKVRLALAGPRTLLVDGEFCQDVMSVEVRLLSGALRCQKGAVEPA
jgi:diacylglycerol kinase (ATP)